MPAQGYVSVPNEAEDNMKNALNKQGKIMRYGK